MFLILTILLINIDLIYSQYLLKRGVTVTDCNLTEISTLTDGDKVTAHTFRKTTNCSTNSIKFFIATLADTYEIYMIIYTGEVGSVSTPNHSLDYITKDELSICGRMPTRIRFIKNMEKGVRINFEEEHYGADGCSLTFPEWMTEVKLAEIEVYGYDLYPFIMHRGCFASVSADLSAPLVDVMTCYQFCYYNQARLHMDISLIAFSQRLRQCLCPLNVSYEDEVSLSKCDAKCEGTNNSCGGNDAHSIYMTGVFIPRFLGCYKRSSFYLSLRNSSIKLHEVKLKNLTFSKCAHYCKDSHYIWFTDGKCGCSTRIRYLEDPDLLLCDIPCVFDKDIVCGSKTTIALYQICVEHFCPRLVNCIRGIFNHYGVCTHGCKKGYGGEHCLERVADSTSVPVFDEPDEPIETDKTGRVIADYIFSIWIAAATFLLILF